MNSKEKIKNIKSVINEFYHTEKCEGRLTECANDCWKSYQKDCDEIKQDLERLEQLEKEVEHYEAIIKRWQEKYHLLEKELLQTKKNFRNSQIHSKNCYKKLKEKYTRLERAYKNNEVMTRDLNELINRNLELKDKIKELEVLNENLNKYIDNFRLNANIQNLYDNQKIYKLEQAIKLLKEKLSIDLVFDMNDLFTQEDLKLLKQVFESVGDKCE